MTNIDTREIKNTLRITDVTHTLENQLLRKFVLYTENSTESSDVMINVRSDGGEVAFVHYNMNKSGLMKEDFKVSNRVAFKFTYNENKNSFVFNRMELESEAEMRYFSPKVGAMASDAVLVSDMSDALLIVKRINE